MNKVFRDKLKQKYPRSFKALVFFVCFAAILSLSSLILSLKSNKQLESSKYPYIDFSRNFQKKENYITNIQPLRTKIHEIADKYKQGNISVYIEYLNTGANIAVNPETYIFPASLLKLPVAMTVMKKIENKEWYLKDKLVLMQSDINNNSGDPDSLVGKNIIGTAFTIEELLKKMLIESDNTAFNIIFRNLKDEEIETFINATGLEKVTDKEGKLSAKEYSRILRSLYTASYLDREYSQKILEWLDQSTFEDFLAKSLPKDVPFSHKHGENFDDMVFSDSGIVYLPNRPYIISVMIEGDKNMPDLENRKIAQEIMQSISYETYKYFSKVKN